MRQTLNEFLHIKGAPAEEDEALLLPMDTVINVVKKDGIGRFLVVDGMRGAGKSASMATLCFDHMNSGQPALYFRFAKLDNALNSGLNTYVLKHLQTLVTLAAKMHKEGKLLVIIIDDLQRYMETSDAALVVTALCMRWRRARKLSLLLVITA